MAEKKRKKKAEMPVFSSIRKPTAPPSRKLDDERPAEKRMPSLRKAKHKKPEETDQ